MPKLKAIQGKVNRRVVTPVTKESAVSDEGWLQFNGEPIDSKQLLVSLLVPPAVKEFMRQLNAEVNELCGTRYEHGGENQRWGHQPGSVVLANQKVRVEKPRVRNKSSKEEVELKTYESFQNPALFDEQVFTDGLRRVSQRDYAKGVQKIGASFGFTKSSVSKRWIKETEESLEKLHTRDLKAMDLVAVIIDGKRFRTRGVVVALGVGSDGRKHVLGIYECNTENSAACTELLTGLEKRGLPERELVFVVDGGSGLNKALEEKYQVHIPKKRTAVRVRCFVHKWRNISENLDADTAQKAGPLFWGIRSATKKDIAHECAVQLESLLKESNESAWRSFLEAKDDLLVIQSLGLSANLRDFFSTTNSVESLNSLTEEDLRRVKNWESSNQFQRWFAASALNAEKRMRRVRGFKNIPAMRAALSRLCSHEQEEENCVDKLMTGT